VLTSLAMALLSNTHVKILFLASSNIWLNNNRICSIGTASIATVLHRNKTIKTFGESNNMIGNDGTYM
jgi:hypothetical protein